MDWNYFKTIFIIWFYLLNRELAPGQRECDRAIEEVRILFQEVDKAITNVDSLHKTDKSLQVEYFLHD